MITTKNIEQLHTLAGEVLRKHNGSIEHALPEFMRATTTGLTPNPGKLISIMPSLEFAARQYLEAYANEGDSR